MLFRLINNRAAPFPQPLLVGSRLSGPGELWEDGITAKELLTTHKRSAVGLVFIDSEFFRHDVVVVVFLAITSSVATPMSDI